MFPSRTIDAGWSCGQMLMDDCISSGGESGAIGRSMQGVLKYLGDRYA